MDYKKSGAPKGGRNSPRHVEKGAPGTSENPFGRPKKAHQDDKGGKGQTDLDKPPSGDEQMAIDEEGAKGPRGLEGHAKKEHEAERKD